LSKISDAILTVTMIFLYFASIRFVKSLPVENETWKFILQLASAIAWGHLATSILYYRRVMKALVKELDEQELLDSPLSRTQK